jgi:hypothetical protein
MTERVADTSQALDGFQPTTLQHTSFRMIALPHARQFLSLSRICDHIPDCLTAFVDNFRQALEGLTTHLVA